MSSLHANLKNLAPFICNLLSNKMFVGKIFVQQGKRCNRITLGAYAYVPKKKRQVPLLRDLTNDIS